MFNLQADAGSIPRDSNSIDFIGVYVKSILVRMFQIQGLNRRKMRYSPLLAHTFAVIGFRHPARLVPANTVPPTSQGMHLPSNLRLQAETVPE